jgi:hypothetical protein
VCILILIGKNSPKPVNTSKNNKIPCRTNNLRAPHFFEKTKTPMVNNQPAGQHQWSAEEQALH